MILDGKMVRDDILNELRDEVSKLELRPKLVVIQVGKTDASDVYIKQKHKMCDYVGYEFEHIIFDMNVDTNDIIKLINRLNNDGNVTGIMIQLPIIGNIDSKRVVNLIDSLKDVDGLTEVNNGKLFNGEDGIYSCTASGIMELLHRYNIPISGKRVVIVNRSNLVGKPLSMMMLAEDATVSICHSKTENLSQYTKNADILVVAVGKPNFITGDMICEDSVVIDVGISKTDNGLCGDVDFASVKDKCRYITPVPGGVGPMTVAMLAKNILKAFKIQKKIINFYEE